MAAQQEQPVKSASVQKNDNFVERQLAQASGRVRKLDLVVAALVFLAGTLFYGLAVTVADLYLDLSSYLRLGAFLVYVASALGYALLAGLFFGRRRVNPYYAARQLEKTLPDAKGSVVNWLDLRDQPLPQAIRGALGARAAKDLSQADVDEAISGRRALWLGSITGGLAVAALVLFLTGPSRFGSLLSRCFFPFKDITISTRTEIVLLQPEGGDTQVPVNQKVLFRVQVRGRVPRVNQSDSLKLLYRYTRDDDYLPQPLERDAEGDWATTVLADQAATGFWYKIVGGDAETAEYRVRVRPIPQVTRFDVKYHYRPYQKLRDRLEHYPNDTAVFPHLKDFRGTEVTLTLKANRTLRQGHLELDLQGGVKKDLLGTAVADDPEALQFKFTLERSGSFRVYFISQEGETSTDRSPYQIDVIDDRTPLVVLHKPGVDVKLPANGTLQLEGSATDDLGIKKLTLRLKVVRGDSQLELEPKPYRDGKSFQLVNGKYPDRLEYMDVVALDNLKTVKKDPFAPITGMQIEYWLEAGDNSDFPEPGGNIGQSKHYTVTVVEPEKDKQKQEQARNEARKKQEEQTKKQDEDLKKRNEEAQRKLQAEKDKEDPAGAEKRREELEKKIEDLDKAVKEQNKPDQRGQAKGGDSAPKSETKEQAPPEQGAAKDENKQPGAEKDASQKKDEGPKGQGADKTKVKDEGKAADPHEDKGQAKDGGQQPQPQAEAKGGKEGDKAGENKSAAKDQHQPQAGAGKDEGAKGQKDDAGKAKDDSKAGGDQQAKAQPKPGGKENGGAKADAKGDPKQSAGGDPQAKSEKKNGPQDQPGQAKAPPQGGEKPEVAQSKPGNSGQGQQASPSQAKGQPSTGPKGNEKKGSGADQQANAAAPKDGPKAGEKGAGAAERKDEPGSARQPGMAKGPQKADGEQGDAKNPQEATAEDVAQIQKKMASEDADARQKAREELSKVEREAKDPKVRKAAEEALKQGQGQPSESVANNGQGIAANTGEPPQGNPMKTGAEKGNGPAAKGDAEGSKNAQGQKGDPNGKGPNRNDNQRPGAGFDDDLKAGKADPNFAKRGGNLQLDDLKKHLTPELLKKMKPEWTEQQRQDFMRDLRAYEQAQRRQQKLGNDKLIRAGSGANVVPGTGPYEVGSGANQLNNPLDSGHFQAPPEFRDAHRRYTSGGSKE